MKKKIVTIGLVSLLAVGCVGFSACGESTLSSRKSIIYDVTGYDWNWENFNRNLKNATGSYTLILKNQDGSLAQDMSVILYEIDEQGKIIKNYGRGIVENGRCIYKTPKAGKYLIRVFDDQYGQFDEFREHKPEKSPWAFREYVIEGDRFTSNEYGNIHLILTSSVPVNEDEDNRAARGTITSITSDPYGSYVVLEGFFSEGYLYKFEDYNFTLKGNEGKYKIVVQNSDGSRAGDCSVLLFNVNGYGWIDAGYGLAQTAYGECYYKTPTERSYVVRVFAERSVVKNGEKIVEQYEYLAETETYTPNEYGEVIIQLLGTIN